MEFITIIALIPIAIVALVYLLRYPEVAFAIFLFSYVIKGGTILPWYLNLTFIMLAITVLGFTVRLIREKKNKFKFKSVDLWFLGFVIILFVGICFTPNLEAGLIKALRFTAIVFFPYLLARFFLNENTQINRFLKTILLLASIVCIVLIIISAKEGIVGRTTFFEANEIPVATLFVVGLVLAVIETMMSSWQNWRFNRILCASVIPVLVYGIFLTGVRGPLIATIIGLVFYFSFGYLKKITPRFKFDSVIVLTLIALGVYLGSYLPTFKSYSPLVIIEGRSTAERLEQYRLAQDFFIQNPLIGVGTGGFKKLTGWSYPHNIFMEVAVENGLIGLIFLGIFLGIVGWYGFRFLIFYYRRLDMSKQKIGLIILTISLILLVGKQFSFGLDMHKDLFVFLALIVNLPIITRFNIIKSEY